MVLEALQKISEAFQGVLGAFLRVSEGHRSISGGSSPRNTLVTEESLQLAQAFVAHYDLLLKNTCLLEVSHKPKTAVALLGNLCYFIGGLWSSSGGLMRSRRSQGCSKGPQGIPEMLQGFLERPPGDFTGT